MTRTNEDKITLRLEKDELSPNIMITSNKHRKAIQQAIIHRAKELTDHTNFYFVNYVFWQEILKLEIGINRRMQPCP